jgi:hypothetical protein
VFYGTLAEREGSEARLENCRRLWYWDGAASLSQLAAEGTVDPQNCKFTMTVADITVLGVIEIIPVTAGAASVIEGVPVWKR